MRDLRKSASLLISQGFSVELAYTMPINRLWEEAAITRERITDLMATEATLLKTAVIDVVSGEHYLADVIEEMRGE